MTQWPLMTRLSWSSFLFRVLCVGGKGPCLFLAQNLFVFFFKPFVAVACLRFNYEFVSSDRNGNQKIIYLQNLFCQR